MSGLFLGLSVLFYHVERGLFPALIMNHNMQMILQLVGLALLSFFAVLEISSGRVFKIVRGFLILGVIILFGVMDIQDIFKNPEAKIAISIGYVLVILSITFWALTPKRSSSGGRQGADSPD